jgi:hypothetical protein
LLAEAENLFAQADQALTDPGGPDGFAEYARLTEQARQLVSDALAQLDASATTSVPDDVESDGDVTGDTTLDDIEGGTDPGTGEDTPGGTGESAPPTATSSPPG